MTTFIKAIDKAVLTIVALAVIAGVIWFFCHVSVFITGTYLLSLIISCLAIQLLDWLGSFSEDKAGGSSFLICIVAGAIGYFTGYDILCGFAATSAVLPIIFSAANAAERIDVPPFFDALWYKINLGMNIFLWMCGGGLYLIGEYKLYWSLL